MKYAVWFVRLLFAAWMLPAGLNHFIPLFPQPLGNEPLSKELFLALFDSHLFDLVKAVELIAGLSALTGFYLPLALVLCMPVSFCVWYWDTPLQGWGSRSSIYGWAVLLSNVFLCLAYLPNYRSIFTLRAVPKWPILHGEAGGMKQALLAARILFGLWMLLSGANHVFLHLWAEPTGSTPLAMQLMGALNHSQLIDVAYGMQLVAGALILVGILVPLAACVVMPISVCAAYWAVILEHEPVGALLALVAVALNALLLFAHLEVYRTMLERWALAIGEDTASNYDSLLADPRGRTAPGAFIGALIPLALVAAFYHWLVFGGSGQYAMLVLLYPAICLHARRLRDMGRTPWLLLIPAIPTAAGIWFHMYVKGQDIETPAIWVALGVSALFTLWGLVGKSAGTKDA